MRCEACGMETKRTDVCDFCGSKMVARAPAPPIEKTQIVNTPPPLDRTQVVYPQAPQVRIALTGEAIPVAPPPSALAAPVAPPSPPPGPACAAPGALPRAARATAGLPAGAVGISLAQSVTRDEESTLGARWELALAIFLPIMALSVLLIKLVPTSTIWVELVDYFAIGLALGASSAIASYDDAFLDCAVVLAVCYVVGPLLTLVAYAIVCAVKQEWNGSILVLLLANCAVAVIVAAAALSSQSLVAVMMVGLGGFLRFFFVTASFAGWMLSNFFRPINE